MSAANFCTVTASVKRNPTVDGITGAPVTHLASLLITPVWPIARVDTNVQRLMELASSRELKECYHIPTSTTLPDVKEGDLLVVGVVEYPVLNVQEWTDGDVPCLQITVQEVKQ